jgi:hypothetical protein
MKIFINENDRHNAFRSALIPIANYHNIQDYKYLSNYELNHAISKLQSPFWNLLQDYFVKYDLWFDFYQKRKQIEQMINNEYDLNLPELQEGILLSKNRQDALEALQALLDKLRNRSQQQ